MIINYKQTQTQMMQSTDHVLSLLSVGRLKIIIIIIIQYLYSAIMSYADTEALVAPV